MLLRHRAEITATCVVLSGILMINYVPFNLIVLTLENIIIIMNSSQIGGNNTTYIEVSRLCTFCILDKSVWKPWERSRLISMINCYCYLNVMTQLSVFVNISNSNILLDYKMSCVCSYWSSLWHDVFNWHIVLNAHNWSRFPVD